MFSLLYFFFTLRKVKMAFWHQDWKDRNWKWILSNLSTHDLSPNLKKNRISQYTQFQHIPRDHTQTMHKKTRCDSIWFEKIPTKHSPYLLPQGQLLGAVIAPKKRNFLLFLHIRTYLNFLWIKCKCQILFFMFIFCKSYLQDQWSLTMQSQDFESNKKYRGEK